MIWVFWLCLALFLLILLEEYIKFYVYRYLNGPSHREITFMNMVRKYKHAIKRVFKRKPKKKDSNS